MGQGKQPLETRIGRITAAGFETRLLTKDPALFSRNRARVLGPDKDLRTLLENQLTNRQDPHILISK